MMTADRGRARIGVLVPFTNINLEPDMALLRPHGASLHFARIGGYDEDEVPDAGQMARLGDSDLDEPLRLLRGARPEVILYGCTSATLTHGPEFDHGLAERIRKQTGAECATAAGALVHALKIIGAGRVGFASPYVPEINDRAISFLAGEGIETVSRADVTETLDNTGQGAMTPDAVFELGERANSKDAQAIVLSCTDMRSVEVIGRMEKHLGKPVVTSNQALMARAMVLSGLTDPPLGFGLLFERIRK